jgi:hypothetical protein
MPTPISVIHAALLRTGHVLFIADAYSPDTVIWDPEDPVEATAFRLLNGTTTGLGSNRLACCGHSFLSDGKLLAVGGDAPTRATAWKFNPDSELWEPAGTMAQARWYPTCVTLGDDSGRVLVVGGSAFNGGAAISPMEIYNESSNTFTPVYGPAGPGDTSADRAFPKLYAGLHLTPNGEIFHTRVGDRTGSPDRTAVFSFTALDRGQWTDVTQAASDPDRQNGFSVLMLKQTSTDPDRVLVVGGGATANTIAVVDVPASPSSMWLTGTFPDGVARASVNAVALPDGAVFILGGIPPSGSPPNGGACMLYRPPSGVGLGTLSSMDTLQYARQHHSTALLLPSAKVMVSGGDGAGNTIEVFSPPYLFDSFGAPLPESARPDITSFPDPAAGTIVLHGSTFDVGTSDPMGINRVVMVKPMAVTHQTDTEQRVIPLAHTVTGPSTISVTAPDGRVYPYGPGGGHTHAIAGRGYYMLFLLNTAGVPSRAKFIRLV